MSSIQGYIVVRNEWYRDGEFAGATASPVCSDPMEAVDCIVAYLLNRIEKASLSPLRNDEVEALTTRMKNAAMSGEIAFDVEDYLALEDFDDTLLFYIESVELSDKLVERIRNPDTKE